MADIKIVDEIIPQKNIQLKAYSNIASVLAVVIRDKGLSARYGWLACGDSGMNNPSEVMLNDLFNKETSDFLKDYYKQYNLSWVDWGYSDIGDVIGWLTRILLIAKFDDLKEYKRQADRKIERIDFIGERLGKSNEHISTLRNAVMHGNFSTEVISKDPSKTLFNFWTISDKKVRAYYQFTCKQLNHVIDIIIKDVFIKYLLDNRSIYDDYLKSQNGNIK